MTYTKIIEKIEAELYKLGEKYFSSDKGIEEDEFSEIVENIEIALIELKKAIREQIKTKLKGEPHYLWTISYEEEIKDLKDKIKKLEEKEELESNDIRHINRD